MNRIQRLVRPHKVGHAGTLDPMADGVLLVPVGQAVRLVDWLHQLPKTYEAVFELGKTSLSGDNQDTVQSIDGAPLLTREAWLQALPNFLGLIEQIPPIFSAVRVDGRRAYDLARQGQAVKLESRTVAIHRLVLDAFNYPIVSMTIECGTGTYIRSLGRDIARRLGSDAIMTRLTRTAIGACRSDHAVGLDEIESLEDIEACLHNPVSVLEQMTSIRLSDSQLRDLIHGKSITLAPSPLARTYGRKGGGEGPRSLSSTASALSPDEDLPVSAVELPTTPVVSAELLGFDSSGRLRSILRRNDDGSWFPFRNFLEGL